MRSIHRFGGSGSDGDVAGVDGEVSGTVDGGASAVVGVVEMGGNVTGDGGIGRGDEEKGGVGDDGGAMDRVGVGGDAGGGGYVGGAICPTAIRDRGSDGPSAAPGTGMSGAVGGLAPSRS